MSTNHNRIKVADLETNQPNKILKTNQNGELEFTDASTLQTDTDNVKLTGNQTIRGEKVFSNTNGNACLNATVSLSGTAATNFSSVNDGLALYAAGFNNKKEIARIIAIDGSATALNLYNQNSATGDFLKTIDASNNTVTKINKDGEITAKSFIKTGGTNEQFLMADGSVKSNSSLTESYNALDCTAEGKSLDARQGKVLKDMIDKIPSGVSSVTGTGVNNTDPRNPIIQAASATQTGFVNNTSLQELGGVDKLINGIRIGKGSGNADNLAIGANVLNNNTTGFGNTAIGRYALYSNISGTSNTALGYSLVSNTTGSANVAIGENALLKNKIGYQNFAIGISALGENNGNENIAIGNGAGYYDGNSNFTTNANKSIFIGNNSRAKTNGETNQIIIGNNAVGGGSNTITIGGENIIKTFLKGTINANELNVYSDNASAKASGKIPGDIYRKSTGELMIVF